MSVSQSHGSFLAHAVLTAILFDSGELFDVLANVWCFTSYHAFYLGKHIFLIRVGRGGASTDDGSPCSWQEHSACHNWHSSILPGTTGIVAFGLAQLAGFIENSLHSISYSLLYSLFFSVSCKHTHTQTHAWTHLTSSLLARNRTTVKKENSA